MRIGVSTLPMAASGAVARQGHIRFSWLKGMNQLNRARRRIELRCDELRFAGEFARIRENSAQGLEQPVLGIGVRGLASQKLVPGRPFVASETYIAEVAQARLGRFGFSTERA